MARKYVKENLAFHTGEKVFYDLDEALSSAVKRALYTGKATTISVMPLNEQGAYQWGEEKAVAKWRERSSDDEPLAQLYIKCSTSYWT